MSSRYDTKTTTFSPEGNLYQVEYATEAISQAGTAIGILTAEGVVFATEKRLVHPLLDTENLPDKNIAGDKVFKIDQHIACAVSGIASDANILINHARVSCQRHRYTYKESMATEDLCILLCDVKQGYTQYGGVRPFGVAFLMGGWDRYHGFQLYHTEPSGNYSGWKAYAIGQNDGAAQGLLKQDWKEGMTLRDGLLLALKVLSKTMDSTKLSAEKVEIATLRMADAPAASRILDPNAVPETKAPLFSILTPTDLKPLIDEAERIREKEEAEEESK